MQGNWDGSFNFCDTDFAIIGFGMNSMGARFNPVSISIVNSESSEAYHASFTATKKALYQAFDLVKECSNVDCKLCQTLGSHDVKEFNILRKSMRNQDPKKLPVPKPSSDNSLAFIKLAKKEFGKHVDIQQCCVHFTGTLSYFLIPKSFSGFD